MKVLQSKWIVCRKEHCCFGCSDALPKHSKALTITNAIDGGIYSSYWCPICAGFFDEIGWDDASDGVVEGTAHDYSGYAEYRAERI